MVDPELTTPLYSTVAMSKDLWRLLRPHRGRFMIATLLRLAGDIVRLYPAYVFAQIIDILTEGLTEASLTKVWLLIASSAVAYAAHTLLRESAKNIGYQVAERMSLDAQLAFIRHLFRLDLLWHEKENSGNKLKRMLKGGQGIDQILRMWITNFIEVGVNFVGIALIIASFDVWISFLLVGFIILYYGASYILTRKAASLEHIVNVQEEELHGLAFEAVNNIRSVKVLGMSFPLLDRLNAQIHVLFRNIRSRILWYRIREIVLVLYGRAFLLSMNAWIVWGIFHHRYDIAFLVLFNTYFDKIWENVDELSKVSLNFVVAKVGIARMMDILHEPVGIDEDAGKRSFPTKWDSISVRNLTFAYHVGTPVLKNLSFTIRRGEKIGIVGVSGAGKSTLFKLLLKEHEHYTGDILIGDVPLKDITRSSFFQTSAVVLQDTEVFNFSLRDNITLANVRDADNAKLLARAMEVAHVNDFLTRLPEGLDTLIGEKGIKLSGGEKQRVGIARAVFNQPDIFFFY